MSGLLFTDVLSCLRRICPLCLFGPVGLRRFFVVGSSYDVVDTGIVVIGKADQHLHGNISRAGFIMGIGTLTDVKNLTHLFLG